MQGMKLTEWFYGRFYVIEFSRKWNDSLSVAIGYVKRDEEWALNMMTLWNVRHGVWAAVSIKIRRGWQ